MAAPYLSTQQQHIAAVRKWNSEREARRQSSARVRLITHAAVMKSAMNVIPTSQGFLSCNQTSDGSPIFGEPQKMDVDSTRREFHGNFYHT